MTIARVDSVIEEDMTVLSRVVYASRTGELIQPPRGTRKQCNCNRDSSRSRRALASKNSFGGAQWISASPGRDASGAIATVKLKSRRVQPKLFARRQNCVTHSEETSVFYGFNTVTLRSDR